MNWTSKLIIAGPLYCLVAFSCRSLHNTSSIYTVNSAEGYINFKIEIEETKLKKLKNDLSFGPRDTCFLYYNMEVFKDLTIQFDSLTYDCLSNKKLDSKTLKRFSRIFRPKIVDKSNAIVAFEPYECVLQFSLEVGQNKNGKPNRILVGYSKAFD